MKAFSIVHDGQRWSGEWSLDGDEVRVDSAYGSERTLLSSRKPEVAAAETLLRIVKNRGQPNR